MMTQKEKQKEKMNSRGSISQRVHELKMDKYCTDDMTKPVVYISPVTYNSILHRVPILH